MSIKPHIELLALLMTTLTGLVPEGRRDYAAHLATTAMKEVDQAIAEERAAAFRAGKQMAGVLVRADAEVEAARQEADECLNSAFQTFIAMQPRILH